MRAVFCYLIAMVSLFGRPSSAPYITGDGFRALADFVFDETSKSFDPKKVKTGDIIFVKTDDVGEFFKVKHPWIRHPYLLITHNGDLPVPRSYVKYLEDHKLLGWFGQNVEGYKHSKLHPLPIGTANQYVQGHGSFSALKKCTEKQNDYERSTLLYMNINVGTNPGERKKVYDLFCNQPFCYNSPPKPFSSYLIDLAQAKFVLSPRGNGLDCHRTWEALYMGAIPIVKSSSLDEIFQDLPVLIIENWEEITERFLEEKYREISSRSYNKEKLYLPYWENLLRREFRK